MFWRSTLAGGELEICRVVESGTQLFERGLLVRRSRFRKPRLYFSAPTGRFMSTSTRNRCSGGTASRRTIAPLAPFRCLSLFHPRFCFHPRQTTVSILVPRGDANGSLPLELLNRPRYFLQRLLTTSCLAALNTRQYIPFVLIVLVVLIISFFLVRGRILATEVERRRVNETREVFDPL